MALFKKTPILILGLLVMLPGGVMLPVAEAGFREPLHVARRGGEERGMSLNEAVRQVQRDTGGRVLSADTLRQGGRAVHRIKVLTPSGHVRVYNIDAQSGAGR